MTKHNKHKHEAQDNKQNHKHSGQETKQNDNNESLKHNVNAENVATGFTSKENSQSENSFQQESVSVKDSTEQDNFSAKDHSEPTNQQKPSGFEINFKGSELLRAKFPKAFKAVEVAADNWINDGDFKQLPVDHPAVKEILTLGLQKAKETEQKIMQSKAVEQATMKAFEVGMKAHEKIQNIKSQFLKK